jgi:hypothetical protein
MMSDMDKIAVSNPDVRFQLFTQTGEAMDLPAYLTEKDFWVCWTLKHLFSIKDIREHLIFKGGTTLSKVYGIINRFSEDIDLTLDRKVFGFEDNLEEASSNKQRDRLIKEMTEKCSTYVCGELHDILQKQFVTSLSDLSWKLTTDTKDPDEQTLLFYYPTVFLASEYNKPVVKLEFGSKSDLWPTEKSQVVSYAARHFSKMFKEPDCRVIALSAERTFWEKATILHQLAHWPEDKPLLPRYSRHYYDLAMLTNSDLSKTVLDDSKLLARVVQHKIMYFRCGWASYQTAKPGTFKIIPSDKTVSELKKDYTLMEPMIFGNIPTFNDIMNTLESLEQRINNI